MSTWYSGEQLLFIQDVGLARSGGETLAGGFYFSLISEFHEYNCVFVFVYKNRHHKEFHLH